MKKAIHAGVALGRRRRFERDKLVTAKPRPPISRENEERPVGGAALGTGSGHPAVLLAGSSVIDIFDFVDNQLVAVRFPRLDIRRDHVAWVRRG